MGTGASSTPFTPVYPGAVHSFLTRSAPRTHLHLATAPVVRRKIEEGHVDCENATGAFLERLCAREPLVAQTVRGPYSPQRQPARRGEGGRAVDNLQRGPCALHPRHEALDIILTRTLSGAEDRVAQNQRCPAGVGHQGEGGAARLCKQRRRHHLRHVLGQATNLLQIPEAAAHDGLVPEERVLQFVPLHLQRAPELRRKDAHQELRRRPLIVRDAVRTLVVVANDQTPQLLLGSHGGAGARGRTPVRVPRFVPGAEVCTSACFHVGRGLIHHD
mmetsp:Transcript_30815/g.77183  ORF Transcript_30815/g.77183 Transcript_30815/m.77183 type:complete len:274 (-) Transcript_30815:1302-2123(-)